MSAAGWSLAALGAHFPAPGLSPAALTVKGVTWMLGGGLIYTVGIVFYLLDERVAHFHGIWHLFVIAGSAMHYATIMGFLA